MVCVLGVQLSFDCVEVDVGLGKGAAQRKEVWFEAFAELTANGEELRWTVHPAMRRVSLARSLSPPYQHQGGLVCPRRAVLLSAEQLLKSHVIYNTDTIQGGSCAIAACIVLATGYVSNRQQQYPEHWKEL